MSALVSLLSQAGDSEDESARLGQKGAWLRWLVAQGERVPDGFVIPAEIAPRLRAREPVYVAELQAALEALAAKGRALAVRASPVFSLPGALLTELNLASDADALTATLLAAIDRVLLSAQAPAARDQLAAVGIDPGATPWLAVVVQVMVHVAEASDFGAVAFTHDPARGEPSLLGEYAPGQATAIVVSGRGRPLPLTRAATRPGREEACLEVAQPQAFKRVRDVCDRLAKRAGEPLELELVVTQGEPWVVQARPLVLSARAALRVALDALRDDHASASRLLRRISPDDLVPFMETRLPEPAHLTGAVIVARGLAASPGVATGRLVFGLEQVIARAALEPVVLVRRDALPEDIAAFRAACAVVTTSGGLTSHAAVIARGLRVPAAIGCADVRLDAKSGCLVRLSEFGAGEVVAREGDLVTVDGHRGVLYAGAVPTVLVVAPELRTLCLALRPRRSISLLVIGPSAAAERAYEECALDGIWDPASNTCVRGPATTKSVQVVDERPTDSLHVGLLQVAAIACLPEHAPNWALWLGCVQ